MTKTMNDDDKNLQGETFELTQEINRALKDYKKSFHSANTAEVIICSLINCLVDHIFTLGYGATERMDLAEKAAQAIMRNMKIHELMAENEGYDF